jgi:adenosylcobinamide-phosphate synthase
VIRALALVCAYALDYAFGEPPNRIHPVAWMGTLIGWGRDLALRGTRLGQLVRGALVAMVVPIVSALVAWACVRVVARSPIALVLVTALLLKPMFAIRALRDAAFAVRDALAEGDLPRARRGLARLCSRSADHLQAPALIAATIESVAENTSDSIVAPILFFAVLGLPGAAFYRAVNTLDAMIGYHGRYEWAGKAAARLDDLCNLVPARMTALLLLAAAPVAGADAYRGWAMMLRDGARTESPNAGRPMAAMAGLLGVQLEKDGHYALGDATRPLVLEDITRAWRLASTATLVAMALALIGLYAIGGGRG